MTTFFPAEKSYDLQNCSSFCGNQYYLVVCLVRYREGGRNDDKNVNAFSSHLEQRQAQQQAALYSAVSTRMPTEEEKQNHRSASCIALPKLNFNEIN